MIPSTLPIAALVCLTLAVPQFHATAQTSYYSPSFLPDTPIAAVIEPRIDAGTLYRIIQPITTATEYANGIVEYNNGNGFIVGNRFYTVNHNLASSNHVPKLRKTSYVNGVVVRAMRVSADHDLAVFPLPDELCKSHCNDLSLNEHVTVQQGQEVFWLRKFDGQVVIKRGRVLDYAWIGESPPSRDRVGRCDGRMVVQIDTPFLPGTSGSPVIDSETGQIIGIAQGSLFSERQQSGFFKPLNCLKKLRGNDSGITLTGNFVD
ncbi:MAG: trypsin-like peptidase domain-containing protein [Rhodothermales bacterium]|nr:trypsin-like peptidase domain-containing protein [Rhodothermales bacterium]